ncbi:hypothetical protein C8Q75DRAFT_769263 [Abortiporus biennis]|nr:hypothetical protein C8Q75DRAFT_769263 [Abortiporus biennis]
MHSWFSIPNSDKHRHSDLPLAPPRESADASLTADGTSLAATARTRPSNDDQPELVVASLTTPHDAILSELAGHKPNSDLNLKIPSPQPVSPNTPNVTTAEPKKVCIGTVEHIDNNTATVTDGGDDEEGGGERTPVIGTSGVSTPPQVQQQQQQQSQLTRSTATSPTPGSSSSSPPESETIYDPFTGAPIGVLPSRSKSEKDPTTITERERDSIGFEQAREDLWNHLSKIRKIQSEIADMHVEMEGIGQGESIVSGIGLRGGAKRPGGPGGRMHSDTIGGGEEWVNLEDAEKKRKEAMDNEFKSLAATFEGRRTAINGIMNKLDELSHAVTTFHALPTPRIDLHMSSNTNTQNTRSNTKDSAISSPILRSPSPMFASPAGTMSPPPLSPTFMPANTVGRIRTDVAKMAILENERMHESPVDSHFPSGDLR